MKNWIIPIFIIVFSVFISAAVYSEYNYKKECRAKGGIPKVGRSIKMCISPAHLIEDKQ